MESRDEGTVMPKKFSSLLFDRRNQWETDFFLIKIFRPIRIRDKIKLNSWISCWLGLTNESTLMLTISVSILFYPPNLWQTDFFYKNFRPMRIREKNQIHFLDLLLIGMDGRVNTDLMNVVFTFVELSKSVTNGFFCIKFFDQSEFEKKSNSIIGVLAHWHRRTSQHWCSQYRFRFRFILQICDERIFSIKIFRPIRIREKIKFNHWTSFSLGSTHESTLMLTISVSLWFYSPSPWRTDFFYKNFSTNQNWRKNQCQLVHFFLIGIEKGVNTVDEKIAFSFLWSS